MRIRDDDRGVAIQVGAAILLAFVVIAITLYQVQVVPQQNAQVEASHNRQVVGELNDVRNAIVSAVGGGSGESVSVTMGTNYPDRTVFLNPPSPAGQLRTTPGASLTVDNAVATGEAGDYWTGTARTRQTRALVYTPIYNEYRSHPVTTYENTVLSNSFPSGNVTETGQRLVRDNTVSLVTLQGSFSRATGRTLSLDLRAVSASTRAVTVTNDSDPVRVSFPTTLSNRTWADLLEDQYASAGGHVVDQSYARIDDTYGRVTLTLERDERYVLEMAAVGIGSAVPDPGPAYVTAPGGTTATVSEGTAREFVVEVRDRFNNPVTGVEVNASTALGNSSVSAVEPTTNEEGRVVLRYDPPADVNDTTAVADSINVSYATDATNVSGFDGGEPGNVRIAATVTNDDRSGLGGDDGSDDGYDLRWDAATIASQPGVESCDAGGCVYNRSADPDGRFDATVNTSPSESSVDLDYTASDGTVVTGFSPEGGTTGASGEATTTVEVGADGTTDLTVGSLRDSESLTLTVVSGGGGGNSPPTADPSAPATVDEGDTASLDGSGSFDPDGTVTSYEWSKVSGPGSIAAQDTTTPAGTYEAPSDVATDESVTLELTVTDDDGATDTNTTTITVEDADNAAPNAEFTYSPSNPAPDEPVTFEAGGSTDPDDSVVAYDWDFDDDGTTDASGETEVRSFPSPGTYDVTLTVTDEDGATDSASETVTVEPADTDRPSIATATLPDREIDNAEAGNNERRNLSVTFDEDMDRSVPPAVAIENVSGGGDDYALVAGSWTGPRTFEWTVEFKQNGADTPVTVNVSDARDLAGNEMRTETALRFVFDANPPGDVGSTDVLTDPINRSNEDDVGVAVGMPSTLEGDETVVVTLTGPEGTTTTVRREVTVSGGETQVVSGVDVSGFADGLLAPAEAYLVDDVGNTGGVNADDQVTKDTRTPRVVGVTVEDAPINDTETGSARTVTVTFDESMDRSRDPTVTIAELSRSYAVTPANGGFQSATTWTGEVTFGDDGEEATGTVVVDGARDAAGNPMARNDSATVTVDTREPSVTSFALANPSGTTVDVAVETDEPVATLAVALDDGDGDRIATLRRGEFAESCSGGTCTYTASADAGGYGPVGGEVVAVADDLGNDGTAGQTAETYVGPNRIVDDFEASDALPGNLNFSAGPSGDAGIRSDGGAKGEIARSPTNAGYLGGGGTDVRLVSRYLNTTGAGTVEVSWAVKEGDDSSQPDADDPGEFLVVEYRAADGTWRELERYPVTDGQAPYESGSAELTAADALHDRFAIRFRQPEASAGDSWYVDDVCVLPGGGTCPLVRSATAVEYNGDGTAGGPGRSESGVSFSVTNTGSSDVRITRIEVDSSGAAAELLEKRRGSGQWDREVFVATTADGYLETGDGGNDQYDLGSGAVDMTAEPVVGGGDTASISLYQFTEAGPGNSGGPVEMNGERVTVTIYFADGSSKTIGFTG